MKHENLPTFRDDYAIGQQAVARIMKDVSGGMALECARDLLRPGYINSDWLAMRVRMLNGNLSDYRKAQVILKSEVAS